MKTHLNNLKVRKGGLPSLSLGDNQLLSQSLLRSSAFPIFLEKSGAKCASSHSLNSRSRSIGLRSERLVLSISAHRSPTSAIRWGIVRKAKVRGPTLARSISNQAHGAD